MIQNEIKKVNENMQEIQEESKKLLQEHANTTFELLTEYSLPDLIHLRHIIKKSLTPLEINIREIELKIKTITINLKNSKEYSEFKTIKAKEEQATLDTSEMKEGLLQLKLLRNQLRDLHELIVITLDLEFKVLEDQIINPGEE